MRQCVLKAQADLVRKMRRDAVAQAGRVVRFMRNHGNFAGAEHNGDGDKAAFAEDYVRLNRTN
ncbi:hypothetical protein SDC9_186213 [bioreactor metagenome]|uniref:Uncharacterized protein n=1 Tax=bioreactor metagenome TaxID=1076179 RepID=A0A645HI29_9ZZZZ